MMFRTITIAALVGFVSANTYSIGCMKTLMDLQQNAEVTTCLQPTLLVPILVGLGNGPESVIGYTDAWLAGMCGAPACTDDTLNTAISKVTTGCSAEFGIPEVQHVLDFLKQGYRTLRKVVCLKDGEVNCVTGSLRNIEAITGTMSLDANNLVSIAGAAKKGFPSSVICTNCMKGAYSIINKELPGAFTDSDTKYATDTCGAQFADGGIPPGLVSSAWEPSNSEAPAPSSTSITPQSTPTIAPISVAPSPNRKNGALGGPSALSSGAFIAVSGFIALLAALV